MANASDSSSGGIGLGGLLFVVFLVLKLTHVIAWSWWWITAPLWMPAIFFLAILAIWLFVKACLALRGLGTTRRR